MLEKETIKKELLSISKRGCLLDDEEENVIDHFGGNFDDAYNGGLEDGEVMLARHLLEKYFK